MNPNKHFPGAGKNETGPSHEEIARAAYRLYELNGRQAGRDLLYWLEAEKALRAAHHSQTQAKLDFIGAKSHPAGNERPPVEKLRKNAATRQEIRHMVPARTAPRQSQQRTHEQAA